MLTVSNYHYIRENYNTNYPSIFGVTPDVFRKQLLLLKDKGDFVNSINLVSNTNSILNSKENYYFITFDDGLKEQFDYALPILEELDIPAVFFVNSRNFQEKKVSTVHKIHLLRSVISPLDFLKNISRFTEINFSEQDKMKAKSIYIYDDNESAVLKYILNFKMDFSKQESIIKSIFDVFFDESAVLEELYMSESQIMDLSKKSFLGSHTHNHYPIGLLDDKGIKYELENSKLYFENLTNSKIETVAYPYGTPEACTDEVARIAKEVGYKLGFTTTRGNNSINNDYLLLNRFDCNDLIGGKNYKEI
jgi:peptidoglycan/xylan/chitin deacetylase (PgdA/CDA1 family)